MAFSVERIKKYRGWLMWGFVSVLFFLLMWVSSILLFGWELQRAELAILLAIGSVLASFTAFLAWVVTTIFTWRKERRESYHSNIELEKKKLELEKLRREVADRNSAAQKNKKTTKRRRIG